MPRRLNLTKEEAHDKAVARSALYLDQSGLDPTLPAFAYGLRYICGFDNDGTMRRYALSLRSYFAWCDRNGLDPFAIERDEANLYVGFVGRCDYAPKTIKTHLAVARSYHRAAFEDGKARLNPFRHVKLSADTDVPTEALTPEDINKVLNGIASAEQVTITEQRDYALIYLGSRVGPRRKELGLLCWEHLHDTPRGPRVRLYRKGGGIDEIDLPTDARAVIAQWRGVLEAVLRRPVRPDEHIFPSIGYGMSDIGQARRGRLLPMGLQRITDMVRARFTDAGLVGPRMSTHVLRASAATIAFENGATVDEIKIMLGHKNVETTWGYLKRINRPSPATRWALDVLPFPGAVLTEPLRHAQLSLFSETSLAPEPDRLAEPRVSYARTPATGRVWTTTTAATATASLVARSAPVPSPGVVICDL